MHKDFNYSSIFADLISAYIQARREAGFMFGNPAYWLFRFDAKPDRWIRGKSQRNSIIHGLQDN